MRTIMERLVNQWIHGLRRSDGLPCVRLRRIPSSCYVYMALWILSSLIAICFAQGATELPPKMFTQQPQAGSAQLRGNTKVLLCFASGTPSPVYRWKKDGVYMTSENLTDSALRIQNIQRPDAGYYQCVASNTHGAILSNEVFVRVACEYT
ncbi:hypothetical protein CAPTEDRAFT_199239 [Capitella teleta]|uniref:Ig-like domain-containing protein n=1 Tax=Capitella teleta TaxID=283909 RepID=R7UPJ3_CAPTE|nr:hypothetical protein CAPTEDRAFT_199239 [Capitella teleta]|eukprot:ELU08080.1 hypothetical protein CAPTEDRAFT_199239 [Capitella teleta]